MDIHAQKSYLFLHGRFLSACGSDLCCLQVSQTNPRIAQGTGHSILTSISVPSVIRLNAAPFQYRSMLDSVVSEAASAARTQLRAASAASYSALLVAPSISAVISCSLSKNSCFVPNIATSPRFLSYFSNASLLCLLFAASTLVVFDALRPRLSWDHAHSERPA